VALALTSMPPVFAGWSRATGAVGAVLFFVVAFRIFGGEPLLATASPLPFFAYPFLVITTIGWAVTVIRPAR